jgi:transposase-like protein
VVIKNEKIVKLVRPPYEELLEEISLLGYVGVGRKYGVSDNSIRKWIKIYKKNVPIEYVG